MTHAATHHPRAAQTAGANSETTDSLLGRWIPLAECSRDSSKRACDSSEKDLQDEGRLLEM